MATRNPIVVCASIFLFLYASPIASYCQEPQPAQLVESQKENGKSVPEQYYFEPARFSLLEKIGKAQKEAFEKVTVFYDALTELAKAHAEAARLKQMPEKKKTDAEKLYERTLRENIIPGLTMIRDLLAEKTLLFVLNKTSGEIHELQIQEKSGKQRSQSQKTMRGFPSYADNCVVIHQGGNGHGMNLLVICDGHVFPVLALAHFHTKKKLSLDDPVHVYSPYSLQIHDKELVREGRMYTRTLISEAMAELEAKKVPSKAYPGEFVHWRFSADFLEAVLIDEHMDHGEFEEAHRIIKTEEPEKDHLHPMRLLIEKVFVTIGANKERAYAFSISTGRACCFAQFIKPTYATMTAEYPEARLEKDFFKGMRDHKNAVQAMVLFFDNYLSHFSAKARSICEQSSELLQDCLAVAYNSGYGRLNNVIERHGEEWDTSGSAKASQDKQKSPKKSRKHRRFPKNFLPPETNTYLEKLRAIREFEKQAEEQPEEILVSMTQFRQG